MLLKKIIPLILLVMILIGCQPGNNVIPPTQESPVIDATEFTTLSTTLSTTITTVDATLLPRSTPTPTITATVVPTVTSNPNYSENCPDLLPENSIEMATSGKAILVNPSDNSAYIYDFTNRTTVPFPNPPENISYWFRASPDRQKLAFFRSLYRDDRPVDIRIMVMDYQLNILFERADHSDAFVTVNWLGNEKLLLGHDFVPNVMYPFSGEEFSFTEWYEKSPGYSMIGNISWDTWGVFDSSLNTILYIDNGLSLVFWDIENEQILAKLETPIAYMSFDQPKWSPDESQIVFSFIDQNAPDRNKDELYSLSRDGSLTQLTHLNNLYAKAKIWYFNWSPDGRYIAFTFTIDDHVRKGRLGVYDVMTGRVTDYCELLGPTGLVSELIWSPDSASIIFERGEGDVEKTKSTVWLDIVQGIAVKIADHLVPEAWIVSAP